MSDEPALPFRVLRAGLKAASRAGATVVERVLRNDDVLGPISLRPRAAARAGGPVAVRFDGVTVRVARGVTVLEAAKAAGVDLRHYCGGNCSCGTCRVEVRAGARNLSRRQGMEEMVLGSDRAARGDRLACQAQISGDIEVHVPEWF